MANYIAKKYSIFKEKGMQDYMEETATWGKIYNKI